MCIDTCPNLRTIINRVRFGFGHLKGFSSADSLRAATDSTYITLQSANARLRPCLNGACSVTLGCCMAKDMKLLNYQLSFPGWGSNFICCGMGWIRICLWRAWLAVRLFSNILSKHKESIYFKAHFFKRALSLERSDARVSCLSIYTNRIVTPFTLLLRCPVSRHASLIL